MQVSMTREEAIKYAEFRESRLEIQLWENDCAYGNYAMYSTELSFVKAALTALRPVSREQVEKVFSGCDFCSCADFGEFGFEITKHYAKICCAIGNWRFPQNEQFMFCPKCGKPLTAEAVDMMLRRWKEAVDDEQTY